ncbi:metallophosphoesterase [Blastococcus saxobsidens]|uniref:Metallophosphoesterase n=1 Tax=Blastococcus saxobsidens (strain DD2) TaxID=1146883 RepID=H6RJF3_BLASD|nr:metallophosphoesterase [Blastococcus saxobsidens]CCG01066.1 Metallophosphoesterase [Blastococcus saxobsidens DD2]
MSVIGLLGFGTVVLLAVGLLHAYLWFRLVRSTTGPGRLRRRLTALTVVLAVLPVAAVLSRGALSIDAASPLSWIGYSWLGIALYAVLALVVLEPVRWAGNRWITKNTSGTVVPSGPRRGPGRDDEAAQRESGTAVDRNAVRQHGDVQSAVREDGGVATDVHSEDGDPAAIDRRRFLARGLAVTAGAVALGTAGTGAYFANAAPVVRRVPVALPGLDPALDGLRIVTFSDGHLSATYGGRRFERLVEIVKEQRPDVVAIVGDLVDGNVDELREDVAPLADLVSEQGVYFVTGNHEYFVDTRAWMRHLPTLGVDVLRNERVAIGRGGATFDLAGIDDRTAARSGLPGHGADLDAALDGRDDSTPVVLLAHQPVMVEQAAAAGVDLQLSGHTHGGQLWPFDYAIRLDQPTVEGLSRHGDTQLYVTSGAGYWGPPMRIGARPEVTVVELRAPRT